MHDPAMDSMRKCVGRGSCTVVPDAVFRAAFTSLENHQGRELLTREERTAAIVPRMIAEGWRFCPCFIDGVTPAHLLIFGLVQTVVANMLADEQYSRRAA